MNIRKLVFLAIPVLFLVTTALSQTIPKKANTILVKNVTLDQATSILLDQGYNLKNVIANTVTTEFKEIEEACRIKITIRVKDSIAIITGLILDRAAEAVFNYSKELPIENRGMKKSGLWYAWQRMDKIAVALGQSREYLIKN